MGAWEKKIPKKWQMLQFIPGNVTFNDWSKSYLRNFYYPSFFMYFALGMNQSNYISDFVILNPERIVKWREKTNEQIKLDYLAQ